MLTERDRAGVAAVPGIFTLGLLLFLLAPKDVDSARPRGNERVMFPEAGDVLSDPTRPITSAGDTLWVDVHLSIAGCPGDPDHGGEATGGPGPAETWCFEGGTTDTTSIGPLGAGTHTYRWDHFDRRTLRDYADSLYWRATNYQAIAGTRSMWCGGWDDACGSWAGTGGGYGDSWEQIMMVQLPGPFDVTMGCSLSFQTRYTFERNYDYAYVEFKSRRDGRWRLIDCFNGKSGCTAGSDTDACFADWNNYLKASTCTASPFGASVSYPQAWRGAGPAPRDTPWNYANGYVVIRGDSLTNTPASLDTLQLRWRFISDGSISMETPGLEELHGWWVDNVKVKIGPTLILNQTFDTISQNGLPGAPFSFPRPEGVYDGWALRHDVDPPSEGFFAPSPGDSGAPSACEVNASWQYSASPSGLIIPPPNPADYDPRGVLFTLRSPAIPLNYSESGVGPFARPGVVVQGDGNLMTNVSTCDVADVRIQVHNSILHAWCEESADPYFYIGPGTWFLDLTQELTYFSGISGMDSVRILWQFADLGAPGEPCWDPSLPPHVDSQFVIDNVSIGIIDVGGASIQFQPLHRFEDTFNTSSCLHTMAVGTAELINGQYILQSGEESLNVNVIDPDGLSAGNVRLFYSSAPDSGSWSSIPLRLSVPAPVPGIGGIFRGTVCDTPWTPGTQVVYYIRATDNLGNHTYFPKSVDPLNPQMSSYFAVEILPTPNARILLVNDTMTGYRDYHPCRLDTVEHFDPTVWRTPFEPALEELGFGYMKPGGYDKYDVWGLESRSEPWGFWTGYPDSPDVGFRNYDTVIWSSGRVRVNSIGDTTQVFLKQFVQHGGQLLLSGERILLDLFGEAPEDPEFVPYLLGAIYQGQHAGLFQTDRFPVSAGVGPHLSAGDSLHIYAGCASFRPGMDRITLNSSGLPAWSHPTPYLFYEDATAPYDTLAGIYNYVTFTPDTGRVVYLPFGFDAIVDRQAVFCDPPRSTPATAPGGGVDLGPLTVSGRRELLADILALFGNPILGTSVAGGLAETYVSSLASPRPNPFNPETELRFELAKEGPASLRIYDVTGRRIRTLVSGRRPAGRHAVMWNGTTDAGHHVSSGIYFARLEAGEFRASEKLTLLR